MNTLLARYVATASLARSLDEGAALAVVLVALDRTGSSAQAGIVVAASTFPQLAHGPTARPATRSSPAPWLLVRGAAVLAGAAAVAIAATLGRAPSVVPLAAAVALALTAPLLTGGLSAIAGRTAWSPRVFAWDSLAYNVAGLAGPAIVTLVALVAPPGWTLVALGAACAMAAVTSLGRTTPTTPRPAAPTHRTLTAAGRAIVDDPPLRSRHGVDDNRLRRHWRAVVRARRRHHRRRSARLAMPGSP